MALRLIESPESPRPASSAALDRLLPAAAAKLAAKDWAGFRAVIGDAGKIEDVHRRYEARRALLAAGLRAGASGPPLVATAASAVEVLEDDPREPVLLNCAGVAFYELGAVAVAESLFVAARALDPALPHVDRDRKSVV